MTIKQAAASIAAITLLAGAPALAMAKTEAASGPIVVNSVQIQPNTYGIGVDPFFYGSGGLTEPGFINVVFQNTSNVVATKVVFELDANGAVIDRFSDAGQFSPGVAIHHVYNNFSDTSSGQLTVAEVKFADGTVWENVPQALRQAGS
ncbi:MAG: hypothetical protein WCE44_08655 [Candidatus Velthaea sp.]